MTDDDTSNDVDDGNNDDDNCAFFTHERFEFVKETTVSVQI